MINRIFTEKYRPKKIEDVIGLPDDLKKLLGNLSDREAILLTSTPGVGKTCISKILERTYTNSMIINASDERGIDVIRSRVKNFAMNMSVDGGFKFIGLEEMDALTLDAQKSLRVIIEETHNCIWLLTANYENKILSAIKNRCTHFKLATPKEEEILGLLKHIVTKENIIIDEQAIKKIIEINYPSIRGMVKKLQLVSKLDRPIKVEDVTKDAENIDELIALIKKKSYKGCQQWAIDSLMDYEYLIGALFDKLMKEDLTAKGKVPGITRQALVDLTMVARKDILFGDYLIQLFEVV